MIKIAFCIYGGGLPTKEIDQAVEFINVNLSGGIQGMLLNLGDTPAYWKFGDCFFLSPWNVPDYSSYPRNCATYFLLWTVKSGDMYCWGGAEWGPLDRWNYISVCSAPYNVSHWSKIGSWNHGLNGGSAIIIHEMYHGLASMLIDLIGGYRYVERKEEHVYGSTIPHIDFMSNFGYSADYEFTQWCYGQISPEMISKLKATYTKVLKITSVPSWAEIYVDEDYKGII